MSLSVSFDQNPPRGVAGEQCSIPTQAATFDSTLPSLHEQARTVRDNMFDRRVFVRGVVEVSSHCRENCRYCAMRRDNQELKRYRLAAEQLAELIIHHRPVAITDIEIQAGEDPGAGGEG